MEAVAPGHLVVIGLVIFVLFFGWKQLPDMSRSLGRSLRIFKAEISELGTDGDIRSTVRSTVLDAREEVTAAADAIRTPATTKEKTDVV